MKHKFKKQILSVLLTVTMVIGLLPTSTLTAFAADGGAGSNANNPVMCNSYAEFKCAMENEDIRYVALGNVDEMMPVYEGKDIIFGVYVKGIKHLKLLSDAVFYAPSGENVQIYDSLLQVGTDSTLYIEDSGSLTFKAVGISTSNAVIYNQGGKVNIMSGNLYGYYNAEANGMAVCQEYGDLTIYGGNLRCDSGKTHLPGDPPTYPAYVIGGTAKIYGGTFYNEGLLRNNINCYGFGTQRGAEVTLYAGTFSGIILDIGTDLSDYIGEGCVVTYDGEKTDPANYQTIPGTVTVEIYKEISAADILINAPVAGKAIPFSTENVYNVPEDCTVKHVTWIEDERAPEFPYFKAGRFYKLEIGLTVEDGVKFADPLESATINYKNATVRDQSIGSERGILLIVDFGKCPATISDVALTIDTPKEHSTPDQSASCGNSSYKQALSGDNMFDTPLQWQESSDGENWTTMDFADSFTIGRYYKVYIDVMPANGYKFALDPQIEPDVSATVNGYHATVSRYPEANPEELISVCYNFGQLNDNIIEQIDIDGVTEPVVDENPNYNCAISGTGYTINPAYSNSTYVINGICWRDITDDKWVYPSDTFQIGHEYKVFVDVKTENGYEFYTTAIGSSYNPAGWGYINDNYATFGVQSDARFEQSLSWTFTCQPKTVKSISVTDLQYPTYGMNPDFDAVTDSEYYTVESIEWYDYENNANEMTGADTFVGGNKYWVLVTVVPKEVNGNKLCKFVKDKTVATLNGVEVKKIPGDSWQEVSSTTKRVQIWYTFKKAASEDTKFVSGSVISAGDVTADITLQLIPEDLSEPALEVIVKGNATDYFFADVAAGTYTLKVSKENHVIREYTVVVTNSSVIQNVKIYLLGDVNVDGGVSVTDVRMLALAIASGNLSSISEQGLINADVNYDGLFTVADVRRIALAIASGNLDLL